MAKCKALTRLAVKGLNGFFLFSLVHASTTVIVITDSVTRQTDN